ncbi:MAG: peptidoglycan editing factor PgeF [Beijerinckiaceae bacterium]
MLDPVHAPTLSVLPGIRHAFFTREGGISQGLHASLNGGLGSKDAREHVLENRRRMAAHLAVTAENFIGAWQVHSAEVVEVSGPWEGERPKADALVTATPGLAISVATADCGPILFADGKAGVIGAAHAGWQGAFKDILENTLAAMERLGARRADMTVAIGPMLSQRNYEVGPEFVERFNAQNAGNAAFFARAERQGHAMFDLPAFVRRRLENAGVGMVDDTSLCTYADEARFYSYRRATHRREADYGRLISAITLA